MTATMCEEIGCLSDAQAGQVLSFRYYGGSDYGGLRQAVKILKSADDNAGNALGLIAPYDESCFRQYDPDDAQEIEIMGTFDPEAEQMNFVDVQTAVREYLGDTPLAGRLVQAMHSSELARAFCESLDSEEVESVTFNEVTAQFEVHPSKRCKFLSTDGFGNTFVETADGTRFCYGCNSHGKAFITVGDEGETEYDSPLDFAAALTQLLAD